ncbi:heavy-metal-associated domain-containing protein [Cupriavidus consociatus]|uniref:heavy-metal-associated domain-containing protein n=1 Tax=Cupriavidus consociatus TaxID=2821357 RepID=UPI001AE16D47|nr:MULTISPECIES: heavy-metal-associated domain-containing protein [unclassified Cupriavidus]MBP0625091.1 heavy-metal-associated domain-containing protein [Cupriavidus sp. LEh25]MDK2661830.1 heavy-metal-associated domain-containing protein [Cupriavidus sp. LEh21]
MITFKVKGITCGHCISTISKALKSVDNQAAFTVDQARQWVMIESTSADPEVLQDAIANAGYTPVRVEQGMVKAAAQAKSCCASRH